MYMVNRETYIPESQYRKPNYTSGGEFLEKISLKPYKGFYIETGKKEYIAGKLPEENGKTLIKVVDFLQNTFTSTAAIGLGVFLPSLKKGDIKKGVTKRYFVKDKVTSKIAEIDLQTFQQAKQLPSKILAEVSWNIKAPAENMTINGYTLEGSASKNKKLIQALEKVMPGISNFVTDYSLLVQPLQPKPEVTQTVVVSNSTEIDLENSRKANFDKKD